MNTSTETLGWMVITTANAAMLMLALWLNIRRVVNIAKAWREIAETLNDYAKTLPDGIDKTVLLAAANERVKCALELLWLFVDGDKPPWIDKPDLIVGTDQF